MDSNPTIFIDFDMNKNPPTKKYCLKESSKYNYGNLKRFVSFSIMY